jgi:hypothetical protein
MKALTAQPGETRELWGVCGQLHCLQTPQTPYCESRGALLESLDKIRVLKKLINSTGGAQLVRRQFSE